MALNEVDKIIAYESGELSDNDTIDFFGELITSGLAWQLQGSYGRMASSLIKAGYIDRAGKVLRHVEDAEA
jgi:hypothetical protein